MSRIYIVEPGPTGGPGAMGAKLLARALRAAGHDVAQMRIYGGASPSLLAWDGAEYADATGLPRPDAWYISCLYPRQYLLVPDLLRRIGVAPYASARSPSDPLVALGGQAALQPAPVAPLVDVLALGDGEATGPALADAAARGRAYAMDWARGRPGYAVPARDPAWRLVRIEAPLPAPSVIPAGRGDLPAIEVARGCRSRCAFCSIGWAGGSYRESDPAAIRRLIADLPRAQSVNLYAPDFSAVTYADDLEDALSRHGCTQRGRDARMDHTYRRLRQGASARSYAFGLEGVSARLRAAVRKPASVGRIVETMHQLSDVPSVKWYLIVGLPGETRADWVELRETIDEVARVYPGRLDLTLTTFQPVPHTPLELDDGRHPTASYEEAMALRRWLAETDRGPGGRIMASQPRGPELHEHDVALQRADEAAAAYLLAEHVLPEDEAGRARALHRWREVWEAEVGEAPDRWLMPLAPEPHWRRIDVGAREALAAARADYDRRLRSGGAAE